MGNTEPHRKLLPLYECQIFFTSVHTKRPEYITEAFKVLLFYFRFPIFRAAQCTLLKQTFQRQNKNLLPSSQMFLHNLILTLLECVTGQIILICNFPTLMKFLQTIVQLLDVYELEN